MKKKNRRKKKERNKGKEKMDEKLGEEWYGMVWKVQPSQSSDKTNQKEEEEVEEGKREIFQIKTSTVKGEGKYFGINCLRIK